MAPASRPLSRTASAVSETSPVGWSTEPFETHVNRHVLHLGVRHRSSVRRGRPQSAKCDAEAAPLDDRRQGARADVVAAVNAQVTAALGEPQVPYVHFVANELRFAGHGFELDAVGHQLPTCESSGQTGLTERAAPGSMLPRAIRSDASRAGPSARACPADRCAPRTLLRPLRQRSPSIPGAPSARRERRSRRASAPSVAGPRARCRRLGSRPHGPPIRRRPRRPRPRPARRSTRQRCRGL